MDRRLFLKLSSALGGGVVLSTHLTGCASGNNLPQNAVLFSHGIASGDPSQSSIMLWTRALPETNSPVANVRWELARDKEFTDVIRSGDAKASANRDYTVKVDVRELSPGTRYYYRFLTAENVSDTGETRTLPTGNVSELNLALFSCSNYPAGFFNAYTAAANDDSIDFVLHLGDYIYEYGAGEWATDHAEALGRTFADNNTGEIVTLADYRNRYAVYRTDKGLRALHQRKPFIVVWDDHEITNDVYTTGAENHQPDEGDFFARRAAAVQAYFEWMPIRPPMGDTDPIIYRTFEFGDLLSLYMLDTRVIGRDKQLSYADYTNPQTGEFDNIGFASDLMAPNRTLLGSQQRQWLFEQIDNSQSAWQALGQQVLMAKMHFPAEIFSGTPREKIGEKIAELAGYRKQMMAGQSVGDDVLHRLNTTMAYNLDAWDGYPEERELIYTKFAEKGKPAIVFAGDTHNGWGSYLTTDAGNKIGVELGTSSVSSPGMESYLELDEQQARQLSEALPLIVKDLHYCDLRQRGYMTVRFTHENVEAKWIYVSTITEETFTIADVHTETYTADELLG
ncbi:alkaline phosphatase [Aestuariibacter sp. A3R04]|uniref:alkaline phosphatase D family protein n=1 Tax=Aestuariibacter sp. A3R04 TaxID=2841571 RepID=UPI001C09C040|nr:alkaline phosphatase D family protein [Aestuariibacter sp. A3R04]MBU3023429.1 alkaline phosphatase D family protein [Aestuariibacter sp. A3R04]